MTTAILYDPRFLDHDTGRGHPERPERLAHAIRQLEPTDWFDRLQQVDAKPCDRMWLETIHTAEYIDRARRQCGAGEGFIDTPDVAVGPSSWDVAVLAAGGALAVADSVVRGSADNGFAMIRPPGHHAEKDTALGFCLFNNVAITARYLQQSHGLEKILILDWDVHHGNGTQHSFESDPTVFYASTHQYPFYPGTGARSEEGVGPGMGTTLNCPMTAGHGDTEYREAFEQIMLPAMRAFKPDAVLISAGFDGHHADPLGAINLTTGFYRWMTEQMLDIADTFSDGRLISLLEGGYDLDALSQCIGIHLQTLNHQD